MIFQLILSVLLTPTKYCFQDQVTHPSDRLWVVNQTFTKLDMVYSHHQFYLYLVLTLQVPLTLPSVFSKTDSVCLKEDTQKCVINNTCPRAFISQYTPMGVYWLAQALGHILYDTHS